LVGEVIHNDIIHKTPKKSSRSSIQKMRLGNTFQRTPFVLDHLDRRPKISISGFSIYSKSDCISIGEAKRIEMVDANVYLGAGIHVSLRNGVKMAWEGNA
jgi:hypothetical protein